MDGEKKEKKDLDTILVEEIGQLGRFQIRLMAVTLLLVMFRAWSSSEYVFTTARINTRCYIPGCDSDTSGYSPEWVLSAVPSAGSGLDNCQRYPNITTLPENNTCPTQFFDTSVLQSCDSYVYEDTDTVVYDFELACDEWSRSFIGSVRMFGMCVALPLSGFISDKWGRRTALAFNAVNAAWLGIVRYWTNTYIGFLISVFMETALAGGVYTSAYLIAMEMLGPKYRVAGAALNNACFSIGQITMAMIAMAVPNWRNLTLALYVPQFISIGSVFLLSESVRWSMSQGRYTQAETILKKIARINKKEISQQSLDALKNKYVEDNKRQEEEREKQSKWLMFEVVKNKTILLRCFISLVSWVASVLIYHGLSINAVNFSGNKYWNYTAVVAVEIPGFAIGIFLINKIGRKMTLAGGYFICAAFQAAYIFIPQDQYVLSLSVYLISKFATAVMVLTLYIYTTELYPTQQRHRFLAFASFWGRIGAIIAPLTPAFGAATFDELPFVLFASSALLAGILTLLLPETLNNNLPDTMIQATDIGKNNTKNKQTS